jgi:hypothetical protein
LYNILGESIKCYVCNSQQNNNCADPVDRSCLEPTECIEPTLQGVVSLLRQGVDGLSKIFGTPKVTQALDWKFVCQKIDISGKKF